MAVHCSRASARRFSRSRTLSSFLGDSWTILGPRRIRLPLPPTLKADDSLGERARVGKHQAVGEHFAALEERHALDELLLAVGATTRKRPKGHHGARVSRDA